MARHLLFPPTELAELLKRDIAIFARLITLLDDWAPSEGAFAHALEWAWHLRLPIHAWALSGVGQPFQADDFSGRIDACAKVCADWGVKLGLTRLEGDLAPWLRQHVEPDDLLIVSYTAGERELSRIRLLLQQSAAVLLCPKTWKGTLSRMLVLYRNQEQNDNMLSTVLEVCRCFRVKPVVLTVARTEREAWRRQQPARAAFSEQGQSGNFDLLIGSEVAEAAIRVARWRQSQLVIMGRYGRPSWTHWLGGSTTEQLLGLAESLPVLTIPKREASAPYAGRSATVSNLGQTVGSA